MNPVPRPSPRRTPPEGRADGVPDRVPGVPDGVTGVSDRVATLAAVAERLGGAEGVDGVLDEYLAVARSIMPCRAIGIYLFRAAGHPPRVRADGVSEYYLELYEEVGRAIDPVFEAVMATGQPASSGRLMSVQEWEATPFFRQVLAFHGIRATLKAPVVARGTIIGTMNFGDWDPAAFDRAEDIALAAALGRIVGLAVTAALHAEGLSRERDQLGEAYELSVDPLVVWDLRTGLRRSNAAARRVLAELSDEDAETLLHDLLAADRSQGGRIATTPLGDVAGQQGRVVARSLLGGHDRSLLVARLQVVDPAEPDGELGAAPAHALLSPRERQIAAAVSLGLHDQQIADALVISLHTVKQHLKNIYRKLGVASRVELTRTLLVRRTPHA